MDVDVLVDVVDVDVGVDVDMNIGVDVEMLVEMRVDVIDVHAENVLPRALRPLQRERRQPASARAVSSGVTPINFRSRMISASVRSSRCFIVSTTFPTVWWKASCSTSAMLVIVR